MSDAPQGDGWWQASDGRWYAPEQHPGQASSAAGASSAEPPQAAPPAGPPQAGPPPADAASGGAPPATPPAAAAASGGAGGGKGKLIVGVVVVLALVAGAFVIVTQLSDDEAEASVLLEPISSTGPDPFSEPVAPEAGGSLLAYAESGAPGQDAGDDEDDDRRGVYKAADGSVPGLYGGSLDEEACDVEQLQAFLSVEDDKADAWAAVLEIDRADIPRYLERLTPVHLGADTRVVNHGFRDGEATPRESVLQRGSAVLVDDRGVPRVSCYCGNPLLPPSVGDSEDFEGTQWEAFEPAEVLVVDEAPDALTAFELRDIETGELFTRDVGSRPATTERTIDGPIDFDTSYDDTLEDERTEARYTFDAPDGAIMTLTVANDPASNRRVVVQLDSEGSRFEGLTVSPGATDSAEIILDHQGGAPFELTFLEGPAAYTFEVALQIQDDAGQGGDAGNDVASGFEVEAGEEISGMLGGQDSADVYLADLVPGSQLQLEIEVDRDSARRVVAEVFLDGERLERLTAAPGSVEDLTLLMSGEDSGVVEIFLTEGPATYGFTLDMVEQTDGGQSGDAGDLLADARSVPTGEELSGQVGDRDPSDWYTFEAPGAETVIELGNAATSVRRFVAAVTDEGGNSVGRQTVNAGASEQLSFESTPGATYRLELLEGTADYTFTIR